MTPPILDLEPERVATLAERAYVGACLHLRDHEARDALSRVKVTDLADPQLRAVLEALQALARDGHDPDPALITPWMMELGLVTRDRAGLVNTLLVDLLTEVPAPPSWSAYAAQVLREAARRSIVEAATRAAQAADGPDLSVAIQVLAEGLRSASDAVARAVGAER